MYMQKSTQNKFYSLIITILLCSTTTISYAQQRTVPFTKGVNMTSWFELWSPGVGNLKRYDKSDLINLQSLGVDVIRLPIHFENLSSGAPDYKVNEITWSYLDKVVDWCEELHMYLVIDNHSFNDSNAKYPSAKEVDNQLQKVWTQVAKRYRNRSKYILYEILNEPRDLNKSKWNAIQANALKTIRRYDTMHTVVVTGANWGGVDSLDTVQVYDDANIIYSFHFYLPFEFTHQGATWTGDVISKLSGIPFPYDTTRMPAIPQALKGTWYEKNFESSYKAIGTVAYIREQIGKASSFSKKNNVPVWCGEMGAYYKTALYDDRVRWYEAAAGALKEYNIPFTVWGYGGGFGLFKKDTSELYPYDLDSEILQKLGFSVPQGADTTEPQGARQLHVPYVLYDDMAAKELQYISFWGSEHSGKQKPTVAWEKNTSEGQYCIRWGNCSRYDAVNLNFNQAVDLSNLITQDANLCIDVRTEKRVEPFEVRFVDSESDNQKPWRIVFTVNKNAFPADGKWHTLVIPLTSMQETGAWVSKENKWYAKENKFDWGRIKDFQICAEQNALSEEIFFDNIRISAGKTENNSSVVDK